MYSMEQLGWNAFFEDHFQPYKEQGLGVGRVLREVRHQYRIYTPQGIVDGDVSGHFQYTAIDRADYPTVGDWVVIRQHDDYALIEKVLPRTSAFSRNRAGTEVQEQVVAANIDYLCIVCGLDGGRNFNLRGIERYIAMTMEGGAKPVIVLNKSDLCADGELAMLQAQSVADAFPIHLVSALTHEGLEEFSMSFESGSTVAFAGHSGVGKSSLINTLLGRAELKTNSLRESDLRGRHTTTHKELFFLQSGAMVIDTPGMRELQLWGSQQSLNDTYSEIHEAAQRCRFNDCTHQNEPGCAVRELLIDGSVEMERYENYLDMRSELLFLESKRNEKKSHERKAKEKALSRLIRRSQKNHKRK
ncbi:ribosome small subunit-dependent GTPase A [Pseudodesulfovibrio sp. zrk46]|uniref:ribosome small subunit-dependent GTPase A n=1 Tax=Pseudodesulfovibrio sp. zrk46 TaxID=2725288 RepID=UPI001449E2CB|nr:ribosome small subunit-dependent GTPase A [Pseudodesulfovibrio sp. zrk46]QJB57046.1 ribosome small subunit-dependent GTPase A [Pseudodesulfovibrio sp. zrk46]